MLLRSPRLKQSVLQALTLLKTHRRLVFYVLFVAPTVSYLISWLLLSTTETFFPRPLREANEVLVVVAHPDDECSSFRHCRR
jgi:hypothetical protein